MDERRSAIRERRLAMGDGRWRALAGKSDVEERAGGLLLCGGQAEACEPVMQTEVCAPFG